MSEVGDLSFNVDTGALERASRQLEELRRSGQEFERQGERSGDGLNRGMRTASGGIGLASGAMGGLATKLGGLGGAIGALGLGVLVTDTVNAYREFETFEKRLLTVTGSAEAADEALGLITEFAKSTPYNLEQAVGGFTKLKTLGLDPSMRALESYGNTAAAMGLDLNQMVEAVADAAVGEFERLKEFGIKAKSEGDNVAFTFQGVTTSVAKEASAIEGYLLGLGEVQFAGAMEDQMTTLNGAFSNLGDSFGRLQRTVFGNSGAADGLGIALRGASGLIDDLSDRIEGIEGSWTDIEFAVDATELGEAGEAMRTLSRTVELEWDSITGKFAETGFADDLAVIWRDIEIGAGVVVGALGDAFGVLLDELPGAISTASASISTFAGEWIETFRVIYPTLRDMAVEGWGRLTAIVDLAFTTMKNAVSLGWTLVTGAVTTGLQVLRGDFSGAWETIVETADTLVFDIGTALGEIGPKVGEVLRRSFGEQYESIKLAFVDMFGWIPGVGDDLEKQTRDVAELMPRTAATALSGGAGDVERATRTMLAPIPRAAADELSALSTTMWDAGQRGAEGLDGGLRDGANSVRAGSETLAQAVSDGVTEPLEIRSPSRLLFRFGRWAAEGLAGGITSGVGLVGDAAGALADTAGGVFGTLVELAEDASGRIELGLSRALQDASSIKDALGNIGDFMRDWLKGVVADFAANRIMVSLGIGGTDMTGATGILNGALGLGGAPAQPGAATPAGGARAAAGMQGAATGGGLAGLTGSIGGLAAIAGTAVVGVGLLSDAIGSMGSISGNLRAAIKRAENLRTEADAVLTETRGTLIGQMRDMGVALPNEFVTTMEQTMDAAVADIDLTNSAEGVQRGIERFSREAYLGAFETFGPELQGYVSEALDLANAPAEDLIETWDKLAQVGSTLVPMLEQSGAALEGTSGAIVASAASLADALGGVDEAMSKMSFFLAEVVPEAERSAMALEQAERGVATFNDGLTALQRATFGGADGIVNTREELYALWQSLDPSSDAAASVANFADSVVAVDNASIAAREQMEAAARAQVLTLESVAHATRFANGQFDPAALGAQAVADSLIDMVGGLDAFQAAETRYHDALYSAEERRQLALGNSAQSVMVLTDQLEHLGYEMPASAEQFRTLRDGLDLSTESGRTLYTLLTETGPAFAAVTESGKDAQAILGAIPASLAGGLEPMTGIVDDTFRQMNGAADLARAEMTHSFGYMAEVAGLSGTAMEDDLGAAFDAVMSGAHETGLGLRNDMSSAFEKVLADAGIVAADLPPHLRRAFGEMVDDAVTTAGALEGQSGRGADAMDDLASGIGTSASALDRIANVLVGAFGDIGGAGLRAARDIETGYQIMARTHGRAAASNQRIEDMREQDRRATNSFATGLDRVPYDGFPALLHEGEAVMKRDVAEPLRQLGIYGTGVASRSSLMSAPPSIPSSPNNAPANAASSAALDAVRAELAASRRANAEQTSVLRAIAAEASEQRRLLDRVERSNDRIDRRIAA